MPSSCPKCHRVLEEDEICCAQVRYTWRCKSCFKLTTGFAVPYGKCFMCDGELEVIPDRDLGDGTHFQAIHDALQFELDVFNFYKLARERATAPEQCAVLEHLYETGLDHLHELEEKYHAHLDREMVEHASNEDTLPSDWPFEGLRMKENSGVADLYQMALDMERRARDYFRRLASQFPAGLDNELCKEVAAEEDEHIAMLETEIEQLA